MDFTRRRLMASSIAASLGASVPASALVAPDDPDTDGAPSVRGELKRFSTTALGAEVTGPYAFDDGTLLYSLQHPSRDNPAPYDKAGIGYVSGFQFTFDGSNDDFAELSVPNGNAERGRVRASEGSFELLASEDEPIRGGDERLGVVQTPDGTPVTSDEFAGTQYANAGFTPDCNQAVPAGDDADADWYLFTNWEASPGNVTRIPISRTDDGELSADLENALNLANTAAFREIGGSRINCYGERSPWGTLLSAEEEYAHARVSLTATVGEVRAAGSGKGLRGAAAFWNRPNPSEIQGAVDEYYGDGSWYVQGYWALTGVEHLAYALGADPVDQTDDGNNDTTPIGEGYPNPYRYGYHVDVREPTADEPTPIKYYVMGRSAWEAPDVLGDQRTVYETSDGDSKGIYRFVADDPIPSYDDPDEIAGTLYGPKVTNAEELAGNSPASTPIELEWLPLGHATNGEVADWITEYDDVTQIDYLETHAETDWQEDLATALTEADKAVVEKGNRDFVTDEEIVEWAAQYERHGHDGVDEDLRKVPFLETRAAAKEIGASIEFNKAEGIDSPPDAGPGDFVYVGLAEFNDAMSDDTGDLRAQRVDGGIVYRAELERDYTISRLEPVIVGPDGSDPAAVADDALINVDNVAVLPDGRVLCCEDADQFGRSYPNDGLYVYQPPVAVDVDSVAARYGTVAETTVRASSLPTGFAGGQVTITLSDPAVATIEDVAFETDLGLTQATISDDGTGVTLRVADTDETVQPGTLGLALATLSISGEETGTTDLRVTVESLDDDSGRAIETEARGGLFVTGPPPVEDGRAPTDPDADGDYEDVNGNGRIEYDDVVTLFEHIEDDSVELNAAAYDFNDNGRLDYDDVRALLEEVE